MIVLHDSIQLGQTRPPALAEITACIRLWQDKGEERECPPHFPFFNVTPRMRDILLRICGLGMALPLS
jgi:hypothetical protein